MAIITDARDFRIFCADLEIDKRQHNRVQKQVKSLERVVNVDYWDALTGTEKHLLFCGSYARGTCLNIERVDLLAILPGAVYHRCQSAGSAAGRLCRVLQQRYLTASCELDGRIVTVIPEKSLCFHILPVLISASGRYICPAPDGIQSSMPARWEAVYGLRDNQLFSERNLECCGNLAALCRMARVWNEEMGAGMSGEVIDTLAWHFMGKYDGRDCLQVYYDRLCLDFFGYLIEQSKRRYWRSIGGKRRIYNHTDLGCAARRAYELAQRAIDAYRLEDPVGWYHNWQRIFGDRFPSHL